MGASNDGPRRPSIGLILKGNKFLGMNSEVDLSLRLHIWLVWVELKRR